MPYPRWLAKMNRQLFNPGQVKKGKFPVLTHSGRTTGQTYKTPMDAFPTEDGFVCVVRYGPESDWVKNTISSGEATLQIDGTEHPLHSPRVVSRDEAVAARFQPPPRFVNAQHFLLMDKVKSGTRTGSEAVR